MRRRRRWPARTKFEVVREATIPATTGDGVRACWSTSTAGANGRRGRTSTPTWSARTRAPPSGVGAVYEWSGNRKAGPGRMEITDAVAPLRLADRPAVPQAVQVEQHDHVRARRTRRQHDVTWRMVGAKTFMTRVMGIFMSMDKMVGTTSRRVWRSSATPRRRPDGVGTGSAPPAEVDLTGRHRRPVEAGVDVEVHAVDVRGRRRAEERERGRDLRA